ncbi:MAG: hypothetical protein KC776_27070 [Myxococcales bacterium]|nr:hypothetical protein [Myxococcales bacterium]MCB9583234.1 hypothetical protein [Polyangiaceae bacterium]
MSTEQIGRLEALLARIQQNAAKPRPPRAVVAPPAVEVEEEEVAMSAPEIEAHEEDFGIPPMEEPPPAIEAEPIEDLELLDEEEFVDLTEAEVEEEEPPASSRRPKAASSMDEALAGAAEQLDMEEGREIPLKTPPPESGPQEAPPPQGFAQPPLPDDLLEADISGPRPEQLGQTVELEEGEPAELELSEAPPAIAEPAVEEEPPISAESVAIQPEVFTRPAAEGVPAQFASAVKTFRPSTFLELLDASLSLGE